MTLNNHITTKPPNHPTTKPLTLLTVALALSAVMGMVESAQGREWSEPVRLTNHFGELMQYEFQAEVDGFGNVHLLYHLSAADSVRDRHIDMYAKYSPAGEPIIRPMNIFSLENFHSSGGGRLAVTANGYAHILSKVVVGDSPQEYYYTKIRPNGEYAVEPTRLEGFIDTPEGRLVWYTSLRLLENGTMVFFAEAAKRLYDETSVSILTYTRFSYEGRIISGPHILHQDTTRMGVPEYIIYEVDRIGNMYIAWYQLDLDRPGAYISVVDTADNVVLDAYAPYDRFGNVMIQGMTADADGSIYLLRRVGVQDLTELYCLKLDRDINEVFYLNTGIYNRLTSLSDMKINNDRIAVANAIPLGNEFPGVFGFMEFNTVGEIVDSAEAIPPYDVKSATPNVMWFHNEVFVFTKTNVAEDHNTWNDNIWMTHSGQLQSIDEEDNSKKSKDRSEVIIYPNPFNNLTNVRLNPSATRGTVQMFLYDIMGGLVDHYKVPYIATDSNEFTLAPNTPSGKYYLILKTNNGSAVENFTGAYPIVKLK